MRGKEGAGKRRRGRKWVKMGENGESRIALPPVRSMDHFTRDPFMTYCVMNVHFGVFVALRGCFVL